MSNALPAREPSMDEILASIRRIIESGDEVVVPAQAPDQEPLHGEPANTAGNATGLAGDAVTWNPERASESEDASIGDREASAGTAGFAEPGVAGAIAPGRPRLGIVPPVEPVDAIDAAQSGADADDEPAGVLDDDAVADFAGEPDGAAIGMAQDDGGGLEAGGEPLISSARQGEVSLASLSEPSVDEVRAAAVRSGDPDEGGEPERAGLDGPDMPTEAIGANCVEEEPGAALSSDGPAADDVDARNGIAEFDEDEFTSQLLENANLIAAAPQMEAPPRMADAVEPEAVAQPTVAAVAAAERAPSVASEQQHSASSAIDANDAAGAPIHELISQEAGSRVAASFDNLARVIREEHLEAIDETVGEILRPMLQEWLDDNLPSLVEKLVREEIERVARGSRR